MTNETTEAAYNEMLALADLEELAITIKELNMTLFSNGKTDKTIIATIHNCDVAIGDINVMVQHADEYDEIVKIESIKRLLTVHQELLLVIREGVSDVMSELSDILKKLTVLYPLLLLRYALKD